ncbi:hypothetical protein Cgig2_032912 [Carnegiea gigantea]|uniref:ATP-dependent Clp protease proteolytic subunit n=1 Tax=Carnegiea gigantea TaxID=171969 RepID=A0A9Q1K173_9CARY|nr:hypothetical protein Cgig2_032912 [Carnegiea gigantea]
MPVSAPRFLLDFQEKKKPRGEVINIMAMRNVMRFVPPDVNTICLEIAASMASYVLARREYKKCVALPHARIMIHQHACPFAFTNNDDEDRAGLLYSELEALLTIRETTTRVYSERMGKPIRIISQDLERDFYMSAIEAKAYGIVDHINEKSKKQNI